MKILPICPLQLSDVSTLPWEIKKSIIIIIIHILQITLSEEKTNSNCCIAALAV